MKTKIKVFDVLILMMGSLIFFSSCSNKKSTPSIYNIDSTLIGNVVIEKNLNLEYNPPKHWISANTVLQPRPTRKIKYGSATFTPFNLFYNSSNKAILSVGEIVPNNLNNKFELETYILQSNKRFDKGNIDRDSFHKDGVDFIRMKITFGVWFTYRIIFQNKQGKFIQFDYALQSKLEKGELPTIESSVGSIHLM